MKNYFYTQKCGIYNIERFNSFIYFLYYKLKDLEIVNYHFFFIDSVCIFFSQVKVFDTSEKSLKGMFDYNNWLLLFFPNYFYVYLYVVLSFTLAEIYKKNYVYIFFTYCKMIFQLFLPKNFFFIQQ